MEETKTGTNAGLDNPITAVAWANAPRLPNYYVKHIEIAQAISPEFTPKTVDPLDPAPHAFTWSTPSVGGAPIPLVGSKPTWVRVYVGDSTLAAGETAARAITVRLTGPRLSNVPPVTQTVTVTAPDVPPVQGKENGSVNVLLESDQTGTGTADLNIEVNPDEVEPDAPGVSRTATEATSPQSSEPAER